MATAAAVDAQVQERITQMELIATESIENAQIFLEQMIAEMPRTPIYAFTTDMPLDIQENPIDADEPVRPDIANLVDNTATPETEAIVMPLEPSDADTALPTPLVLEDIPIPADISVQNIVLNAAFPVDNLTDTIVPTFDYTEAAYNSALLDALNAKLLNDVENGGTGLDVLVEAEIFARGAARDLIEIENAVQRVRDAWSTKGFTLPNGALAAEVQKMYDDFDLIQLDKSKDISIKQAELAQTNTHFALSSSIAIEGQLLQHADNVANRALEAAKSVVELGVALFNVQLQRYQAALEAYKTAVQAFVEELRGESLKVQTYSAQMTGAKIKAEVQGQRISNYGIQVSAISEVYNNYKIQVEAAGIKATVEAEKLRAFKIQVEAEVDKVRAIVAVYEADTSRYRANVGKGTAEAEIKLKQQSLISQNHEGNLKLAIENAKINLNSFLAIAQMRINASLGGTRAYTTLAAGAMDSISSVVQLGYESTLAATETT